MFDDWAHVEVDVGHSLATLGSVLNGKVEIVDPIILFEFLNYQLAYLENLSKFFRLQVCDILHFSL